MRTSGPSGSLWFNFWFAHDPRTGRWSIEKQWHALAYVRTSTFMGMMPPLTVLPTPEITAVRKSSASPIR